MKRARWDLFKLHSPLCRGWASGICALKAGEAAKNPPQFPASTKLMARFAKGQTGIISLLVVSIITLALLLTSKPAHADDPVLRLTQADFILSDAPEPPPDSAPWQPQTLPDNWQVSRAAASGYAWYRLRFDLPKQVEGLQAIYVPWLRTIGAVYLNGTYIGQDGTFEKPEPGARPQLFSVRPELLRPTGNTLFVRLWVNQNWRGALSEVTLGSEAPLRRAQERALFERITAAQMTGVFALLLSTYMLLLWLRRPKDSMYGYFAIAAISKGVWITGTYILNSPVPEPYWGIVVGAGADIGAVALLVYGLRFAGWHWPRFERVFWLWVGLSFVIYCVDSIIPGHWLLDNWGYGFVLVYYLSLILMLYIAWSLRTIESVLLALGHLFSVVTVTYSNFIDKSLDGIDFAPHHFTPLFLIIGWVLVDRFARSVNQYEKLNAELEARVEQKHAELEQNYHRLHELEQQQAVVAERQRIMSDMHDGVGAQLISALSAVEHGDLSSKDVATALRECIDDLRLTIDSLEPTENDLLPVLGNLRYRLDGRLKKQGIDLDWQVKDVPKLACLNPKNVLHILRILQEAFTNVLKHTHASMINVETGVDALGKHVFIRVSDNGNGFAGEHKGHGLDNMRRRAHIIGGELDIQSSPTGTTLNLLIPVS
jgi:signal transduction histidine kinase